MGRLARRHFAWPPRDEWDSDATVGEAALDAGVGSIGIEALQVVLALIMRAVVTGENHQRVLRKPQRFEVIHHSPHITVETCDHRSLTFVLLRPIFVCIGAVVRDMSSIAENAPAFIVGMRDDHAPIEEEG